MMIVGRRELAEALGISPTKVNAFQQQGVFPTVSRGKYDLAECVQRFIEASVEHLIKKNATNPEGSAENLQYWKMIRQKNAALKEMGVTMQVEQAEKLMSARLGQIRNVLTAIDSSWAPYLVGIKNQEQSQQMLSKLLDNLFEQLSTLQDFELDDEVIDTDATDEDEEEIDEQDA